MIVKTFYTGTGEWGTSIRAWPPTPGVKTSFPYDVTAGPSIMRRLLELAPFVPPSGQKSISYDLVMVGFAFLQVCECWGRGVCECWGSG